MSCRVGESGQVVVLGRVERPGQVHAGLRGGASPVVFEEDPGSVACPRFIPPTRSFLEKEFLSKEVSGRKVELDEVYLLLNWKVVHHINQFQ